MTNHQRWLLALMRSLTYRLDGVDDYCVKEKSSRDLEFVQWHAKPHQAVVDADELSSLGRKHRELHDAACDLIEDITSGSAQPDLYDAFENAEESFFDLLNALLLQAKEFEGYTDYLTALPNRKAMDLLLIQEQAHVNRKEREVCVVMADVDHFKSVNDTYGHAAGDQVLMELGRLFKNGLRESDFAARYGGEEFLICFSGKNQVTTKYVVERLRHAIEETDIEIADGAVIRVTCSFGIASLVPGLEFSDAVGQADQAMYLAKTSGRNQTMVVSAE